MEISKEHVHHQSLTISATKIIKIQLDREVWSVAYSPQRASRLKSNESSQALNSIIIVADPSIAASFFGSDHQVLHGFDDGLSLI